MFNNFILFSSFDMNNSSETLQWMDCVEDDNKYLNDIGFYHSCPSSNPKLKYFDKMACYVKPCAFSGPESPSKTEYSEAKFMKEKREKEEVMSVKPSHSSHYQENRRHRSSSYQQHLYPETSYLSSTLQKSPTNSQISDPSFGHYEFNPYMSNLKYYPHYLHRFTRSVLHKNLQRLLKKKRDSQANKHDIVSEVIACRVLKAKDGDMRKRCDKITETRGLYYNKAISLFPSGTDLTKEFAAL